MSIDKTSSRREWLRLVTAGAALPAVFSTAGCRQLLEGLAETCPEDPAESGGVDWTPDILHPVFYGFQDLDSSDGAPGPLRIWYPTYEGFTSGPPILKLCLVRWPLVLFLHGQPPLGCSITTYYQRWALLPAILARCGYVVVVPQHGAPLPNEAESPAIDGALDVIDWVRDRWEHKKWVDARAEATAVVGHSYGALLAGRVAHARPSISAYAGLSGGWHEISGAASALADIDAPAFFMWATGNPITAVFEDLDALGLWAGIPAPKTAAVFPGEHFDYLQPVTGCSNFQEGDCSLIKSVAGELVALFLARHCPVNLSQTQIPVSLDPPSVTLTQEQQFFAGGHLNGLQQIETRDGCSVDLRWQEGSSTGSRHLGP